MAKEELWYVSQRSEALAIVYLTRRDDFTVTKAPNPETGLDLLVTIGAQDSPSGRLLGVVLQPLLSRDLPEECGEMVRLPRSPVPSFVADLPFPVCCFRFVVDRDYGYYCWLMEPIVGVGAPSLVVGASGDFKRLTNGALEGLALAVNAWYDDRLAPAACACGWVNQWSGEVSRAVRFS
jgi:hypothetical protein